MQTSKNLPISFISYGNAMNEINVKVDIRNKLASLCFQFSSMRGSIFNFVTHFPSIPMTQEPKVGLDTFLFPANFFDTAKHTPLATRPQHAMVYEMYPAKKIYARGERLYRNLVRMQREPQLVQQEIVYAQQHLLKLAPISRKEHKIVRVPYIRFHLERMLHELVELIHIDIHEKLRCEISERKTDTFSRAEKTPHNLPEKPQHVSVWYALGQYRKKALLVYGGKELPYIAFQYPHRTRVIVRDAIREPFEMFERLMTTFLLPTRVRACGKCLVEKRIMKTINGAMQKTVAHARFVYAARLRVRNAERFVCGVLIGFGRQISMEREDVVGKAQLKLLHVLAITLAAYELGPRPKEIFERDDAFIPYIELRFCHTL